MFEWVNAVDKIDGKIVKVNELLREFN